MVTVVDEKLDPEFLAMVAMVKSGIYEEDSYDMVKHWNNPDDKIHKFWEKFTQYLEFQKYEIISHDELGKKILEDKKK